MKLAGTVLTGIFVAVCGTATAARAQESDLAFLRERARSAPQDAAAQTELGRALLRAGRYREADTQLRRAARLLRNTPEALFEVARVAFEQGDYRRARAACAPLARAGRTAALTRVCNARAFLVWNRSARAFEELEAAIAAEPNNVEALIALGDAHRLRADVANAESAYQRAIAAAATRPEPHLGLGKLYLAAGRRDPAIASLRRALALDPKSPDVQYELGRAIGGDEGKRLLEQAVAGRPGWADAQVGLGDALLAAGDAPAAERAYTTAIRLNDRLADAHAGLGRAKLAQNQLEAADDALHRALELVPNSPVAVLALAELLARQERPEEAFEQYRHAADLDARNPLALLRAAELAVRLHREVLAAGFLDRLLQQHATYAPALALYGDIMKARGDRNRARDYYQRALRGGEGQIDRARVQASLRQLGPGVAPRPRPPAPRR